MEIRDGMTIYLWGYAFIGLAFVVLRMHNTIQKLKREIEGLKFDIACLTERQNALHRIDLSLPDELKKKC